MNLEEKKAKLLEEYKDNTENLIVSIGEIVFDITDYLHCEVHEQVIDRDSRELFQTIMNWAWEFQYNWVFGEPIKKAYNWEVLDEDYRDYLLEIDYFSMEKIKEEFKED